jgi:DNA-binding NtrC family response regulator
LRRIARRAFHEDCAGLFREDLFYRLNVVPIRVPSLRERWEDLPLVVSFFAARIGAQKPPQAQGAGRGCGVGIAALPLARERA